MKSSWVVKNSRSLIILPRMQIQALLCEQILRTVRAQASYSASLCLNFCLCKMEITILYWVEKCLPPKKNSCPSRTLESDLIWKQAFADVIRVGPTELGWALNSTTVVFIRRLQRRPREIRGEHHVTMEAETGVTCLQAKECWNLQKLEEARSRIFPIASEESTALPKPWFQPNGTYFGLLVFRTVRGYIPVALSHQVCGNLLQQPQETNTASKNLLVFCLTM